MDQADQSKDYEKIIAKLVTKIDQLETELAFLHSSLKQVGFTDGITTLKETLNEVMEEEILEVNSSFRADSEDFE